MWLIIWNGWPSVTNLFIYLIWTPLASNWLWATRRRKTTTMYTQPRFFLKKKQGGKQQQHIWTLLKAPTALSLRTECLEQGDSRRKAQFCCNYVTGKKPEEFSSLICNSLKLKFYPFPHYYSLPALFKQTQNTLKYYTILLYQWWRTGLFEKLV